VPHRIFPSLDSLDTEVFLFSPRSREGAQASSGRK
jgi:hypothetical protein